MISALDISTSGLTAQRARLDAIAGNIANMSSVMNENGELKPYQARYVEVQTDLEKMTSNGGVGVRVSAVKTKTEEPMYTYAPNSPLAVKTGKWKGHVARPSISMTEQMVDALTATRAYEANIGVMEISKNMGAQTLRILA